MRVTDHEKEGYGNDRIGENPKAHLSQQRRITGNHSVFLRNCHALAGLAGQGFTSKQMTEAMASGALAGSVMRNPEADCLKPSAFVLSASR